MTRRTRRGKVAARVLATILSVTMGLSTLSFTMPGNMAYAMNDDGMEETLVDVASEMTEDNEVSEDDAEDADSEAAPAETPEDASGVAADDEKMADSVEEDSDEPEEKEEVKASAASEVLVSEGEDTSSDRSFDDSKTDVWDLGAEDLGEAYNNRLDAAAINGFYPGVEPGTKGVAIDSFSVDDGDFEFVGGGYVDSKTGGPVHRYRSINTAITRYDDKSLKDENGNVFSGYIYSNKGSNLNVYLALECKADDVITAYVASNGGKSSIHFQNMTDASDDAVQTHELGSSVVSKMVFYPAADARYRFYSADEKLVVARVIREHARYSTVSGSVTGYDGTGSVKLVFTNRQNGNVVEAEVKDGSYSARLAQGFDYDITLEGAKGYVIITDKEVNLSGDETMDVTVSAVELTNVKGHLEFVYGDGMPEGFEKDLNLVFTPQSADSVYAPEFKLSSDGTFEVTVETNVYYDLTAEGVDDYELLTKVFQVEEETDDFVIQFIMKVVIPLRGEVTGAELALDKELADTEFTFTLLDPENNYEDTAYSYTFTGFEIFDESADLREGQYRVAAAKVPAGYAFDEVHSYDAKMVEGDLEHTVKLPFVSTASPERVAYAETVTVGSGKDYETINDALEAIRNMDRTAGQRVTVEIQPGDYQEMLVIDTPDVTFKNAVNEGSITPVNKGVSVAADSVRITGYYGHGYTYFSMGSDCKYDAKLLEVNKYNGYASFENPGSGTTAGSYWNATVVVNAEGFEAYDIIFENSFNQYQSELAADDTIISQNTAKEYLKDRETFAAGDVAVQDKKYVERAAALAVKAASGETYFNHCAFIGRQDTLYGDAGSKEAYYNCDIYGGTDYIFGGMTAVFAKCNLVFNTSDADGDYGFVTAAQQKSADARGYLMYNCKITSTVPGENTASTYASKPGYLGRPWQPNTAEVVFYNTVIDATCYKYKESSESLIHPIGWNDSLGGTTVRNVEYGTYEMAEGVDNTSARASWVPVSETPVTTDGKDISVATFLGDWDPFTAKGDDMEIVMPDGKVVVEPDEPEKPENNNEKTYIFDATTLKADKDKEEIASGTSFADAYFFTQGAITKRISSTTGAVTSVEIGKAESSWFEFTVTGNADVKIETSSTGGTNSSRVALIRVEGEEKKTIANEEKIDLVTGTSRTALTYYNLEEGTYRFVSPLDEAYNRGARVYTISVTETITLVETEYVFDSTTLTALKDKEEIPAGTTFADAYYVTQGTITKRTSSTTGAVTSVEIGKGESSWFEFTVTGSANVTIETSSTGGTNSSKVALIRVEGENKTTIANEEKLDLVTGTSRTTLTYYNLEEGTYRFVSPLDTDYNRGARVYKITTLQSSAGVRERKAWDEVADPVINGVALSEDGSSIEVTYEMETGFDGADTVSAVMYNAETGDEVMGADEIKSTMAIFKPARSGKYFFVISAGRAGELTKVSGESEIITFVLPLAAPSIKAVTNKGKDGDGKGRLEIAWTKVAEAGKYDVEIVQGQNESEKVLASAAGLTVREIVLGGLPIGESVTVKVYALRDKEKSEPGTSTITVTGNNDRTWTFSSYGSNAKTTDTATVNADGSVSIKTPSSTKIVPGSTDGLGYYYTKMDSSENFTLTAKMRVDTWPNDNGQEGFGLMVADAVGEHGDDAAFWNNSYQAAATQIQYNWDPTIKDADGNYVGGVTNVTSDSETIFQAKMRLGLGWIARDGVTLDQKLKVESGQITTPSGFATSSGPFETSVPSAIQAQLPGITSESAPEEVQAAYKNSKVQTIGDSAAASWGQFNIIDASKAAKKAGETVTRIGDKEFTDISEVRYQIQRNNTGYVLRYLSLDAIGNEGDINVVYATDENGNRSSYVGTVDGKKVVSVDGKVYEVLNQKIIYDENRNSLTQIDKRYIYVGMFSARKSAATFGEISLQTVDPEADYPAEAREYESVALNAQIISPETSNTEKYDLTFSANADGTLTVAKDGKVLVQGMAVTAGKWAVLGSSLKAGDNKFDLVFTPAPGYAPGEYKRLVIDKDDASATSVSFEYTVKYEAYAGDIIYVAPGAKGNGSKENPASIYNAVSYAAPGQKIYLAAGTYNLGRENGGSNKNIDIDRGTDGTAKKMITMETDPDDVAAGKRAVLSFKGSTGTGSAFVLAGNYWHLKNFDVTGSKNGEKGLHVAGKHNIVENVNAYMNGNTGIEIAREGNVGRDLWPSDNLILNCTSYLNYDAGFEDADGFAAKITAGEGNRFVGCVAAYNADDGWDLFAKVQTGSIGSVSIEGCIAYKNGYLLGSKDGQNYEVFTGADAVEFKAGNGNGFKLGGDGMSGYHVLSNSYAFENKANGIDSNSCPDIQVYNCVSYANGTNLALTNYTKSVNSDYTVKGLVSIGTSGTAADSINKLGNQVESKIYNGSNFFWNGNESVNAVDTRMKATDKIFKSVTMSDLGVDVANGNFVNRDGSGNISFGGFLQFLSIDEAPDADTKAALECIYSHNGGSEGLFTSGSGELEFVVFAQDVKTLKDVEAKDLAGNKLPEGYEWMKADTATSTYTGTSAEFGVYNKETGSTSTAVVSFIEVKGVELSAVSGAATGLFDDGELTLEAVPVYVPEVDDSDLVSGRFTFSFADKKKLGLNEAVESNRISLTRQAVSKKGVASYVATMKYTAGGKTYKLTSNAYAFSTRAAGFGFEYTVTGEATENDERTLITAENAGAKFKLENLKATGLGDKDGVKVSVGDSKILRYSNGTFTAVRSGATYITLTAAADSTAQKTIRVKVKGREFSVVASSITIDKAKSDGVSFIVSKQGDAALEEVTVSKVYKGTAEKTKLKSVFEIRKVIANSYTISIKADTDENGKETGKTPQIANGTYTLILASGENEFEPLTVVVTATRPYVTVRQKKLVNLFYKAGTVNNTGALRATSSQASVTLKLAESGDFNLASNGSNYQLIMTDTAQKKINEGGKLNRNIKLIATFDGYKSAYNKTINFTVGTETRAPRYKVELGSRRLYTALGIRDTELKVLNLGTGEYVTDADITLATSSKAYVRANRNFTLDEENGVYTLGATKSGTAKISIIDPDFSKNPASRYSTDREVILDVPVTVTSGKPSVQIETAKLNGQSGLAGYSTYASKVSILNSTDYTLRNFELVGNSKAADRLLPYLKYSFGKDTLGQPVLTVSFKDSEEGKTIEEAIADRSIKSGSFSFTAKFDINRLEGRTAQFTVNVMKNGRISRQVGGNINLADRTGSHATVTPYLYNLGGTATGMYFKGAENLFDVQWDSSKNRAYVYAKEDGSYRANSYYNVTPVFTVTTENGVFEMAASPVNIYVRQSRLTMAYLPVIEVRLSDPDQSGMAAVSVTSPRNAKIASMVQINGTDKFDISYDEMSGNIYVDIANAGGLKEGRTYSVKMGIVPEGNGSGRSQQTFNVKVRVIR